MINPLFSRIQFPIYLVGYSPPIKEGEKTYYLYKKDDTEIVAVIDDKSVPGHSLARRRLSLLQNGVNLAKLKYAIFFISDLLKLSKKGTWFVDSEGYCFEYVKTKRVPLIFKEVSKIIPLNHGGALVEVKGIMSRFKVLHAPSIVDKYAGLLVLEGGYLLYGLYSTKLKDTTRVV